MKISFKTLFHGKKPQEKISTVEKKAYEIRANLLRQPSNDLFEKPQYMQSKEFWSDPENILHYLKGQYLADGGCWDALPHSNVDIPIKTTGECKCIVDENGKLIRIYERNGNTTNPRYIHDVNPETGKVENIAEFSGSGKLNELTTYDSNYKPVRNIILSSNDETPTIETFFRKETEFPNYIVHKYSDGTVSVSNLNEHVKISPNGKIEKSTTGKDGNTIITSKTKKL